jgi:hypothetical protein
MFSKVRSGSGKKSSGSEILSTSVAEPEPHILVGAGAVTRCGSGSGFENSIKHG